MTQNKFVIVWFKPEISIGAGDNCFVGGEGVNQIR